MSDELKKPDWNKFRPNGRSFKRNGKNLPSQTERRRELKRELKEQFNIHLPRGRLGTDARKALRELKEELAQTWPLVQDALQTYAKFSQKQIRFAKYYALNGRSNKSGAARDAGYETTNGMVLLEMANRNLALDHMEELIVAFEHEQKAKLKMTVDDVVKYFSKIADAAMGIEDFTNANRAMENLAKYLQMFVTKTEITHRTVSTPAELDARIAELTAVLDSSRDEIDARLTIN